MLMQSGILTLAYPSIHLQPSQSLLASPYHHTPSGWSFGILILIVSIRPHTHKIQAIIYLKLAPPFWIDLPLQWISLLRCLRALDLLDEQHSATFEAVLTFS